MILYSSEQSKIAEQLLRLLADVKAETRFYWANALKRDSASRYRAALRTSGLSKSAEPFLRLLADGRTGTRF